MDKFFVHKLEVGFYLYINLENFEEAKYILENKSEELVVALKCGSYHTYKNNFNNKKENIKLNFDLYNAYKSLIKAKKDYDLNLIEKDKRYKLEFEKGNIYYVDIEDVKNLHLNLQDNYIYFNLFLKYEDDIAKIVKLDDCKSKTFMDNLRDDLIKLQDGFVEKINNIREDNNNG